jgi:hypothetical protein
MRSRRWTKSSAHVASAVLAMSSAESRWSREPCFFALTLAMCIAPYSTQI